MSVTDLHSHVIPRELIDDARRGHGVDGLRLERDADEDWLVHRQGYRYPVPPTFHDLEARLAAMDAAGVGRIVASPSPTIFLTWAEASVAIEAAVVVNDAMSRLAAASGGRIVSMGMLPMQDPDAAARELRRATGELGLAGASIGPTIERTPLDDPMFAGVLRTAEEVGVPLMLHPYYVGPRPGLEDFYLSNLVGNPLESTVAAARLILSGALDRHPALRIVLVHGGGYLPYQIGRLDHGYRVRPESRRPVAPPSSYLSRFTFDTITHDARALGYLIRLVGADRVAYGTDFPFDMAAGTVDAQLGDLQLTNDERRLVANDTAERLFHLAATGDKVRRT